MRSCRTQERICLGVEECVVGLPSQIIGAHDVRIELDKAVTHPLSSGLIARSVGKRVGVDAKDGCVVDHGEGHGSIRLATGRAVPNVGHAGDGTVASDRLQRLWRYFSNTRSWLWRIERRALVVAKAGSSKLAQAIPGLSRLALCAPDGAFNAVGIGKARTRPPGGVDFPDPAGTLSRREVRDGQPCRLPRRGIERATANPDRDGASPAGTDANDTCSVGATGSSSPIGPLAAIGVACWDTQLSGIEVGLSQERGEAPTCQQKSLGGDPPLENKNRSFQLRYVHLPSSSRRHALAEDAWAQGDGNNFLARTLGIVTVPSAEAGQPHNRS